MPDPLPVATLAEWEADARAARNDHVGCDNPRCGVHRGPERVLALLASHAALEERVKELEEDLANATGGFDAAMGLADAEQERAKAAEQRVRDLEAALLRYGHHDILCAEHVVHTETWGGGCICGWLELDAALRGTGEGNRG